MDQTRINRLRVRAWRPGFRGAELNLGPVADKAAAEMSEERLERFERLLEQNDHDIYSWIVGAIEPPAEFDDDLLAELRTFRPDLGAKSVDPEPREPSSCPTRHP